MLATLVFPLLLASSVLSTDEGPPLSADSALPWLADAEAAKAFINSAEVVVVGFLEGEESHGYKELVAAAKRVKSVPVALCSSKEAWAEYSLSSDTIALFRKADEHQENIVMEEAEMLDADGLVMFISTNEVRYMTEYNQRSAVGLFNSKVKSHLLLLANRGSKDYTELRERLSALAPEFTGKFLFVLIHGLKSNLKSIEYFGLNPKELPRVGIYDSELDQKWLLPKGEISTERVRDFCHSFLRGELKVSHRSPVTRREQRTRPKERK